MGLVTEYTEESLAQYMFDTLEDAAADVGWGSPEHQGFTNAVQRTMRLYGISELGQATDLLKLEVLARLEVWRGVMASSVTNTDVGEEEDQNSVKRAQIYDHAKEMYQFALGEAAPYLPVPEVTAGQRNSRYASRAVRTNIQF